MSCGISIPITGAQSLYRFRPIAIESAVQQLQRLQLPLAQRCLPFLIAQSSLLKAPMGSWRKKFHTLRADGFLEKTISYLEVYKFCLGALGRGEKGAAARLEAGIIRPQP